MNDVLKIGKNKGLYEIKRQADETQAIITRLRAYGSTRNMPTRYYNKKYPDTIPNNMAVSNLMLPGFPDTTSDPYIDSDNKKFLGIREASVFFDGSDEDLDEIYPCLNEAKVVSAEQATDDGTWDDLNDGDSIPNFKITIEDIGFDINDYLSDEAATISFKTGKCAGREFEIVSCTYDATNKHYILNCARAEDTDIDLYFPNKYYNIQSGDEYVLLNIEMPDVYIEDAAQRLLTAAKKYLAENDYVRYTYTPSIDEIRLKRQDDEAQASNGKIDSIYQTIKEGDIMAFDDEDIGSVTIAIDTLKITEEDEKLPKVTVTLTDEKTVGTIEKIQNKIDAIVSGGTGSGATTSQLRSYIEKYGKKNFLSRVDDDTASGLIKFLRGIEFANSNGIDSTGNATLGDVKAEDITADDITASGAITSNSVTTGAVTTDTLDADTQQVKNIYIKSGGKIESKSFDANILTGYGFQIDKDGNAVLESATIRRSLTVPELVYNRVDIQVGDKWNAAGGGTIESVTADTAATGTITLKLQEGEIGAVAVDDICMGIFHSQVSSENSTDNYDDGCGNRRFAGFYTCYFRVTEILDTTDNSKFRYALRPVSDSYPTQYQPAAAMDFVAYGNFSDTARQRSFYFTRTYQRYLSGVSNWQFSDDNIMAQFGEMSNLNKTDQDGRALDDWSIYLNSIYFGGSIKYIHSDDNPLRLELNTNGDNFMAWGETLQLTSRAYRGWKDYTDEVTAWKIERDSGDAVSDAAWALRDKAKNFDGTYQFYYGDTTADGTESDLPLNDMTLSVLFIVTATIGTQQVQSILEI
jgi:hypothetical protein